MSAAIVTDLRMRTSASTSRPYAWMALAAMSVFVLIGMGPVLQRGPWLDEFWTLWLSAHDAPLDEIFWQRWMADLHPPLFSLMHWLAEPWAGDSYVRHRMLNLVPLAWCALFVGLVLRRHATAAPMVCVFLVCFLSLPVTTEYFAEMRSYFSLMCLLFSLVGCVMVIHAAEQDLDRDRDLPLLVFTGVTVVVALNLNYIGTAVGGLVGSAAVVACALTGKRRWSVALIALMAVSMIPLVGLLVIQQRVLSDAAANYWVSGTLSDAVLTIRRTVKRGMVANPVALLAVCLVLAGAAALALRAAGRSRRRPPAGGRRRSGICASVAARSSSRCCWASRVPASPPSCCWRTCSSPSSPAATCSACRSWSPGRSRPCARTWWRAAGPGSWPCWSFAALGQHATLRSGRLRAALALEFRSGCSGNWPTAPRPRSLPPSFRAPPSWRTRRRSAASARSTWPVGTASRHGSSNPVPPASRRGRRPARRWSGSNTSTGTSCRAMPARRRCSRASASRRRPFDMERARAEVGDTGFVLVLPVKP